MESIDDLAEKLQKNLKMAKEDEEESRGGFDLAQYKVKKCPDGEKCQKETLKCMFYHSNADRRRTSRYSASLCRFNPCRRYPDCPYAHNQVLLVVDFLLTCLLLDSTKFNTTLITTRKECANIMRMDSVTRMSIAHSCTNLQRMLSG